jgi:DNA-binding response OmpR family regulator
MSEQSPVVAVVNTNPDLVRLLRVNLEAAGFIVFVIHIETIKLGGTDVESVLRQHDPKVIGYDVAPPYDLNWRFLDHLRTSTAFKGRHFVLTTVNVSRVQQIVGPEETVYEVVGEPTDVLTVVRAVKEATRARDLRSKSHVRRA